MGSQNARSDCPAPPHLRLIPVHAVCKRLIIHAGNLRNDPALAASELALLNERITLATGFDQYPRAPACITLKYLTIVFQCTAALCFPQKDSCRADTCLT